MRVVCREMKICSTGRKVNLYLNSKYADRAVNMVGKLQCEQNIYNIETKPHSNIEGAKTSKT